MESRTELDEVAVQTFQITLGGRTFDVRPLAFGELLEWSRARARVRAKLEIQNEASSDNEQKYLDGREYVDAGMFEDLRALVMRWLKASLGEEELEWIEQVATVDGVRFINEITAAFHELDSYVNPLRPMLTEVCERLSAWAIKAALGNLEALEALNSSLPSSSSTLSKNEAAEATPTAGASSPG